MPAEIREEYLGEAWLALWQARHHLEQLPLAAQIPYAIVCIRRRIVRFCLREQRARSSSLSLEQLHLADDREFGQKSATVGRASLPASGTLLDQIGEPGLAAAVAALPPVDQDLLGLAYVAALTDPEIARLRQVAPATIKMRRHRALQRLRRVLGESAARGVSRMILDQTVMTYLPITAAASPAM
jgi:RNA polymerase sigma factor (sigma-70 family)